ncbi:hypothetical protein [Nocardioides sp. Kera G14]|uniref:hypothetical protein n=1 Tax=Nocardioides sp. Kera G14 TaxID=2884264 RepID=UPI001D117313|nr:hypothetical protein [Nocardioides sp. Kera G14]UDY22804.1 hypothetical protein LH076_12095 [Nocardioides sp. Kera G14]
MGAWRGVGRTLAVATLLSAAVVAVGVWKERPDKPATPPLSTSLASLDTSVVTVRRAPFCSALRQADVEAALEEPLLTTDTWGNGDQTDLDNDASTKDSDVVHEFGCRWAGGDDAVAAWVFAPPITGARATALATEATKQSGCTSIPGAAPFGAPSVALECVRSTEGSGWSDFVYAGLFGDTWLTCTLTGMSNGRTDLADRWCAAVLGAASAPAAG